MEALRKFGTLAGIALAMALMFFGMMQLYTPVTSDIESYIALHISDLSPVAETMGGTFYITEIRAKNGTGVVHYEDGHMAYIADFTYEMKGGEPSVLSFVVRQ